MKLLLPGVKRNLRGDNVGVDDVLLAVSLLRNDLTQLGVPNCFYLDFGLVVPHEIIIRKRWDMNTFCCGGMK